jgi:hypothetical protein
MRSDTPMITNMLYGSPFRDMRLLGEGVGLLEKRVGMHPA